MSSSSPSFVGQEFLGKWKLQRSENFDAFLKSMGVPFMVRKVIALSSPTVEITYDGEMFTLTTQALTAYEIRFKLGEEFVETAQGPSGEKFQSIITMEDGKLVHKQLKEDPCEYIREITGDEMKITCMHKDVICYRYMKRVAS